MPLRVMCEPTQADVQNTWFSKPVGVAYYGYLFLKPQAEMIFVVMIGS
jgi:hypothetical protein